MLYPFGFGLSYSSFSLEAGIERAEKEKGKSTGLGVHGAGNGQANGREGNSGRELADGRETPEPAADITEGFTVWVKVTNTGNCAGKEVVQVYCQAPQGALGKPARSLCGFAKTKELAPGETQKLRIPVSAYTVSSYDDSGASGHKSCWVLEAGDYVIYVGTDVRSAAAAAVLSQKETAVVKELEEACGPVTAFDRIKPRAEEQGKFRVSYEAVPLRTENPGERRKERLPESRPCTGDKGYKLSQVEEGSVSMEDFLDQLSDEDLCCMVRGEGMCSPKVTPGTAGAFGGVTERL